MADPWTAAFEEAEASVPPSVDVYATLEFQHASFLDENDQPMAIRVVAETPDDQLFTIEDGAALNGGEEVSFKAIHFFADLPEVAEGQMPEVRITIDDAARELVPLMEAAIQIKASLVCLFRQYRSDDRAEPCYGPVSFVMRRVKVKGATVSGLAKLDDLGNAKFPRGVYTVAEFRGLLP
jgi:hypothetical protein